MSSLTVEAAQFVSINALGNAVLEDSLYAAHKMITASNGVSQETFSDYSDGLAFIQGTSLEIALNFYNLAYDADDIRRSFFTLVDRRDLIE